MKFSDKGYPLIVLSHRGNMFLPQTLASIKHYARGITDVIVVDDSGDPEHHQWLDDHGYQFSTTSVTGESVGYLEAMRVVWFVAQTQADAVGAEYVMLWEEDFQLRRALDTAHMRTVMDANAGLAHLNLQRQPCYRIERQFGYMESHQRRGYGLARMSDEGVDWVARQTPFTTNPGLIRREALDIEWPTREVADATEGGAEVAMSNVLEADEWYFGWLGTWNTPHTRHVGDTRKTGIGY